MIRFVLFGIVSVLLAVACLSEGEQLVWDCRKGLIVDVCEDAGLIYFHHSIDVVSCYDERGLKVDLPFSWDGFGRMCEEKLKEGDD